jgi:hypothetical protein
LVSCPTCPEYHDYTPVEGMKANHARKSATLS